MDAYNYNLILGELCLLPNKNLDLNTEVPKLEEQVEQVEKVEEVEQVEKVPEVVVPEVVVPEVPEVVVPEVVVPEVVPEIAELSKLLETSEEDVLKIEKVQISQVNPTKKVFNQINFTKIEPLKLLKAPIKRMPIVMHGGKVNLDFTQINELIYNNPVHLSVITKYYYDNYNQIMNSDQIINVLVSFIYNEFTDPDVTKELESIITLEYIKAIPEMYTFNFRDKVMSDLLKICPDIKEKFAILDKNIKLLETPELSQKGGKKMNKRADNSNDKTVEEKIKNNINILSTFLKSKRTTKLSQKGGAVTLGEMYARILQFNALTPDEKKDKHNIREMQETTNIWVVELLEEKLATKIIRDDEYNIARYFLQKIDTANGANLEDIIRFVNANASILTLKDTDKIKIDLPNKIDKVNKYGTLKPSKITDQLKEYFNKKYLELLKLRNLSDLNKTKKPEDTTDPIQKLALVISEFKLQKGGQDKTIRLEKKLEETFEEKCFTSKQLGIFLRKAASYLRLQDKKLDDKDIIKIQKDITTLEEIEKDLIKNYKIFDNYVKIQSVYPDTSKREITIDHMNSVFDNNQRLFDNYGNINKQLFGQIETLEKYLDLKEVEDNKELNKLYDQQTGGKSFNTIKSYLKFNTQNDIEHFTSRSFQDIIKKIDEDD
jgi:hypothetical protein